MAIRSIYIHEDVEDRLRKEKNISGLINSLLASYFSKAPEEMKGEIDVKIEELKSQAEVLAERIKEREQQENARMMEETANAVEETRRRIKEREEYIKSPEYKAGIRERIRPSIMRLDVDDSQKEAILNEFVDSGEDSFSKFIERKGIKEMKNAARKEQMGEQGN